MANDAKGMFISYRRDESAGYTGRIADRFTEHFGKDRVFRDIDSIEPGLDFAEAIESAFPRGVPFRFTAYDGSATGPADATVGLHLKTPRGPNFALNSGFFG